MYIFSLAHFSQCLKYSRVIGREGGPAEGYAEALVMLGNFELTFASVLCQLNNVSLGLLGPSGLMVCM